MKTTNEYSYSQTIADDWNEFWEELDELIKLAESFIHESGYEENVECNERIMLNVMLDFYSDVSRLKEFHSISNLRTEKNFAYKAAWILRRKPLQFIRFTEDEKDIFVNERFAAYLVVNECMFTGEKTHISKENRVKLDEYLDLLLYYFKYREGNPQTIELAIESFKLGTLMS